MWLWIIAGVGATTQALPQNTKSADQVTLDKNIKVAHLESKVQREASAVESHANAAASSSGFFDDLPRTNSGCQCSTECAGSKGTEECDVDEPQCGVGGCLCLTNGIDRLYDRCDAPDHAQVTASYSAAVLVAYWAVGAMCISLALMGWALYANWKLLAANERTKDKLDGEMTKNAHLNTRLSLVEEQARSLEEGLTGSRSQSVSLDLPPPPRDTHQTPKSASQTPDKTPYVVYDIDSPICLPDLSVSDGDFSPDDSRSPDRPLSIVGVRGVDNSFAHDYEGAPEWMRESEERPQEPPMTVPTWLPDDKVSAGRPSSELSPEMPKRTGMRDFTNVQIPDVPVGNIRTQSRPPADVRAVSPQMIRQQQRKPQLNTPSTQATQLSQSLTPRTWLEDRDAKNAMMPNGSFSSSSASTRLHSYPQAGHNMYGAPQYNMYGAM